MNYSKNFITHLPSHDTTILFQLRAAFKKQGTTIKWYKTKSGYSVYFRGNYIRKPKQIVVKPENLIEVPVVDLQSPAFDIVERNLTPELQEVA